MDLDNIQWSYNEPSTDERAIFANRIGKLIWQLNTGNVEKIIIDFELFREDLEKTIRNVYELSTNEVPIMGLFDLKKHGAENFGLSEEEYLHAINVCIEACKRYYETYS